MADNRSTSSARSCPRRVTTIATATTKSLDVTKGHALGHSGFGLADVADGVLHPFIALDVIGNDARIAAQHLGAK
jgi:hypothetical protein